MNPAEPPGTHIGSGRTSDVYALPGGRVLRRYRNGMDARDEATLLAHLGRHGYPVPAVYPLDAERPGDLVLERLHGPTMGQAFKTGAQSPARTGATLARLLDQLHAIHGNFVHLDLHPENVLSTARGPVVIDWTNAERGRPPGVDRAMSAMILAEASVGPLPQAEPVLAALIEHLSPSGDAPFTEQELEEVRAHRAANPTLSEAEKRALDTAVAVIARLTRSATESG